MMLQATRLQTEFEENNTANILLCLSVRLNPANLDDLIPRPSSSMNSAVVKGDIISHLRNSVRVEAAKRKSSLLLQNPVSAALSVRAAAAVTAAAAGLPPPPPSQAYNPTTFAYASAAPPMIDTRPIDHTMWQSRMANPSTASISPVGHDDSSMEEMDEDSVSPSQDDKTSGDFKTMDLLEQTVTNEELFAIRYFFLFVGLFICTTSHHNCEQKRAQSPTCSDDSRPKEDVYIQDTGDDTYA